MRVLPSVMTIQVKVDFCLQNFVLTFSHLDIVQRAVWQLLHMKHLLLHSGPSRRRLYHIFSRAVDAASVGSLVTVL